MYIVFVGLTITSSWGNGHASTFRSLIRGLHRRGHRVAFYERNQEWYASNRDLPGCDWCDIHVYGEWEELRAALDRLRHEADAIIAGSYAEDAAPALERVLEGGRALAGFYDIDTPVTLSRLRRGDCAWLRPSQIAALDLYLSFTGGAALDELRHLYRAPCAVPLYCCCDPALYYPGRTAAASDLNYMGTFAPDRQRKLQRLLLEPARRLPQRRFEVAGPLYPDPRWPANVRYRVHVAQHEHRAFYLSARMTLNLTRQAMVEYGYSPSVRLFEAAACGVPVLSDAWPGLGDFFEPGREILIARESGEVVEWLNGLSARELSRIGEAARARVLARHTGEKRAQELEALIQQRQSVCRPPAGSLA